MAYRKYLPGGSLNPYWVNEQEQSRLKQDLLEDLNSFVNILKDPIFGCISIMKQPVEMCTIIHNGEQSYRGLEQELEAKFNFIKRHSDSKEDLQLAREIIGLSN